MNNSTYWGQNNGTINWTGINNLDNSTISNTSEEYLYSDTYNNEILMIDERIETNLIIKNLYNKLNCTIKSMSENDKISETIKNDIFIKDDKIEEKIKKLLEQCKEPHFEKYTLSMQILNETICEKLDDYESNETDIDTLISNNILTEFNKEHDKTKIFNECINEILKDSDINIVDMIKNKVKLNKYYKQLSKLHIYLNKRIINLLNVVSKKMNGLKEIMKLYLFEENENEIFKNLLEKNITKNIDKINKLLEKYIPCKIKLTLILKLVNKFTNISYKNCKICLSNKNDFYTVSNCGHCFCKDCLFHPTIERCPICRVRISNKIKLYL